MSNSSFPHAAEPNIVITEADMDEVARRAEQVWEFFSEPTKPPTSTAFVVSRCIKAQQDYHLAFEQRGDKTWAVRRSMAYASGTGDAMSKYGAQADLISGSIDWANLNSGKAACPYCQARSVVRCGACRRLSCHPDGKEGSAFACPWCGNKGTLAGAIETLDGRWGKGKGS